MGTFFTGLKGGEPEFAGIGDKVIVITTMSGRIAKNGRPISFALTTIWKVKDGKIVDIVPFYYDTKAISDLAAQ